MGKWYSHAAALTQASSRRRRCCWNMAANCGWTGEWCSPACCSGSRAALAHSSSSSNTWQRHLVCIMSLNRTFSSAPSPTGADIGCFNNTRPHTLITAPLLLLALPSVLPPVPPHTPGTGSSWGSQTWQATQLVRRPHPGSSAARHRWVLLLQAAAPGICSNTPCCCVQVHLHLRTPAE